MDNENLSVDRRKELCLLHLLRHLRFSLFRQVNYISLNHVKNDIVNNANETIPAPPTISSDTSIDQTQYRF